MAFGVAGQKKGNASKLPSICPIYVGYVHVKTFRCVGSRVTVSLTKVNFLPMTAVALRPQFCMASQRKRNENTEKAWIDVHKADDWLLNDN